VVPPCSDRISRVPPYSRTHIFSTRTGLSPTMAELSISFRFLYMRHWPGPRSLVTTSGVSVDVLSSGYLDISVPRVCLLHLCIQYRIPPKRWVSPFGYPRIKVYWQLPEASRSLSRPSSPAIAKASTKCPYSTCLPSQIISTRQNIRYSAPSLTLSICRGLQPHPP
jgi:hypothetical protein